MIKKQKADKTIKTESVMTNNQAATLIAKMHADLVSRLRYENKLADPNYAEATALAIMALKKE